MPGHSRPRLRHPGPARRRRARPRHRRTRGADPPEHVVRVREQRARGVAVQHGARGPRLQPHQQPDQRGARGAHRRARRRRRRDRHRQRPGRAASGDRHARRRRLAHRGLDGAVRRHPQPAALHAGALRHRDHVRQAARHRRLARARSARTPSCCSARRSATRAWTCSTSPRVSAIAHERRPAAAGRLDLHHAVADEAVRPRRRPASIHSATKFLSGHGTVVGGVLVDSGAFDWSASRRFPELTQPYSGFHGMVFAEESTTGAFLLRARREGPARLRRLHEPAHRVADPAGHRDACRCAWSATSPTRARWWSSSPAHAMVGSVGYPELDSHPDHALAKQLLPRGCGAVFSFDLKGSRAQGTAFIEALKIFSHLANVGDCRSLVIHPASTTHFRMDDAALAQAGIGPGTIRLSIGLEDADDLIDDLGARAEGGAEGRGMNIDRPRPRGLRLHRRQAVRPRAARRGVRARRAARPQRVDPAEPLPRAPRPRACWRSTCPAHGRSGGRAAGAWQALAAGSLALVEASGLRRSRAGRPQHGLADRAGGRRAPGRSAPARW